MRAVVAATAPAPPAPRGKRAAAVLLLLDPTRAGLPLLFVERSQRVTVHRGQIGFPGGAVEPDDPSVEAAALREAHEEVGVDPARVEVLGRLRPLLTRVSDMWLTPVVGVETEPQTVRPDGYEVADWFRVPLADLMAGPHRTMDAGDHPVHFYDVGDRVIWGVTGHIVHDLCMRLQDHD